MSFSQLFDAQKKSFGLGLGLILAILATRTQHFGSTAYLPDATLAVLFLGGLLIAQRGWLALAIISAFAMDAYAIGWMGVSDYCMSPAYWGLIPTYAMVWGAGRWLAKRAQPFALLSYAAVGWAAASAAFIVSNAFWYQFSGRFTEMPVSDFVQRVSQYYTPYVGYSVMYLGVAWAVHRFIIGFTQPKTSRV
ncbi:MAG TPA: hypothetical protein VFX01_06890 [Methylophilaceae bacterium]|nr:hypothetical protein [Methylophilaceae bacterium]